MGYHEITAEDLKRWHKALHTQYQFCSDAIIARHSADAPSLEQLGSIRLAHLSIIQLIKKLMDTMEALDFYARREHWMEIAEGSLRTSLVAMQGDGEQHGWLVARKVLYPNEYSSDNISVDE